VLINNIVAHGGLFTTKDIGQTILSAALNTKVTVNKNASEGGPYGMAILAKYLLNNKMSLSNFLTKDVFINNSGITVKASVKETKSFERYAQRFKKILNVEKEAITQIGLMVNK
jgi:sugar (pentulose or hexulose) kinase